jgi:hypothetical protein
MTIRHYNRTLLTLAAVAMAMANLLTINVANADFIVIADPTTQVIASSEIGAPFDRMDDYIVDGSGLSSGQHNNGSDLVAWLSTGIGFGDEDFDPSVIFDLGAVYTINSFHVWNYNENSTPAIPPGPQVGRGVNDVSVEYGTTAALGSTVPGITNFAIADGTDTYTGEDFGGLSFNAQYIMFDINSNHGDANAFYGLSEVQFDGVAVIPEPASLAVLGLGSVMMLVRRRRG